MSNTTMIERAFEAASLRFREIGVDAKVALSKLESISISLHCWQGDDVRGFEGLDEELSGGLAVTGNHPGRARNVDELRSDLEKVFSLLPGQHRVNLHAIYAETGGETGSRFVDRDELEPAHFAGWVDWAGQRQLGLDFNPSYFAHEKARDGFTLSHEDEGVRGFWVEHGRACRRIGAEMGRVLGTPCVTNFWIPDGHKDLPVDRRGPRERLTESLDLIFARNLDPAIHLDSLESKLFGIGSESYVVGSHEYYLGYAMARQKILCLDSGHFHPTETITDKISAVLPWVPGLLLHISRGVRWDSDHVVILSDEVTSLAQEVVRSGALDRIHVGLDFFDASINRVAGWVIGARAVQKAFLLALLEPTKELCRLEREGDFTGRLALLEEQKSLPWSAVWDFFCLTNNVPHGRQWLAEVRDYEARVLLKR